MNPNVTIFKFCDYMSDVPMFGRFKGNDDFMNVVFFYNITDFIKMSDIVHVQFPDKVGTTIGTNKTNDFETRIIFNSIEFFECIERQLVTTDHQCIKTYFAAVDSLYNAGCNDKTSGKSQ